MTLIAGFRCSDGFVIAGDTEITLGSTVMQGHKLVSYGGERSPYAIRIGIAGDEGYALAACQDVRDAVAALPSATFSEIKLAVRRVIEAIYRDQIFPFWQATGQQTDPYLCLILGVEDVDGQFGVLKTDRNNVHEVDHHACAGTGTEVAELLIERLLGGFPLSAAATEQLAYQLFRAVKINGVYVGGNTEIISRRSLTGAPFFDLSLTGVEPRFLWGLDEIIISAVRTALTHGHPVLTEADLMQLVDDKLDDVRSRLSRLQNDRRTGYQYKNLKERRLTEYRTDFGNPFRDLHQPLIPSE